MFSFTGKSFLSLITFEIQEKQLKIHFLGGGGGGGGSFSRRYVYLIDRSKVNILSCVHILNTYITNRILNFIHGIIRTILYSQKTKKQAYLNAG